MITVLANGCFDLLHVGHIEHLKEAKSMGDILVVSLTTDEHVDKGPGRPIYTWEERARLLRELRCVDVVVPASGSVEAIRAVRPNIFVKGIDYVDGWNWKERVEEACKEVGAELRFTRTSKYSATDAIMKTLYAEHGVSMWERTAESLPPKGEILAVIHRVFGPTGGEKHEEACWDGEQWIRRSDREVLHKNYYYQWRRLET